MAVWQNSGKLIWLFLALHMRPVVPNVELSASPTELVLDVTRTLNITCTFSYDAFPNVFNLAALTISKSDDGAVDPYQDLASIDMFSPNQVKELSTVNGSTFGQLSDTGEGFLALLLDSPSENEEGFYKCQASGLDNSGQPAKISKTVQVTSQKPTVALLLQIASDLQTKIAALQNKVTSVNSHLSQELSALNASAHAALAELCLPTQASEAFRLNQLTAFETKMSTDFERMKSGLFEISPEYDGRVYYLSTHGFTNADVAEFKCHLQGGYLVEVNDNDEYNFIMNFTSNFSAFDLVLLGANDISEEGQWNYTYSKLPIEFESWASGEPNDMPNNCMVFNKSSGGEMYDNRCYFDQYTNSVNNFNKRYLCEIQNF